MAYRPGPSHTEHVGFKVALVFPEFAVSSLSLVTSTLQERIGTFRNSRNPSQARPTAQSYGLDALPLSLEQSSVFRNGGEHTLNYSQDMDGIFGHFHLADLSRCVTSPVLTITKGNSQLETLKRSKYVFTEDFELVKMKTMAALKFAESTSVFLGTLKFYLVWPENMLDLVPLSSYEWALTVLERG